MLKQLAFGVLCIALMACATYRDDLDRAVNHYNSREYEKALVLFNVLEHDVDSLSPQERAQYCFFRGMSHYLLEQRANARHWLGRAAAREKAYEGALNPEEAKKTNETLRDLNQDRWGGAKTKSANKSCTVDSDCNEGQYCESNACTDPPGTESEGKEGDPAANTPAPVPDGGCSSDADCPGTEICDNSKCTAP